MCWATYVYRNLSTYHWLWLLCFSASDSRYDNAVTSSAWVEFPAILDLLKHLVMLKEKAHRESICRTAESRKPATHFTNMSNLDNIILITSKRCGLKLCFNYYHCVYILAYLNLGIMIINHFLHMIKHNVTNAHSKA